MRWLLDLSCTPW